MFGTYNIQNIRNGGLESALFSMAQANTIMGVMKETNLTRGFYALELAVYLVVASVTSSQHSRGVVLFFLELLYSVVEANQK